MMINAVYEFLVTVYTLKACLCSTFCFIFNKIIYMKLLTVKQYNFLRKVKITSSNYLMLKENFLKNHLKKEINIFC